MLPNCPYAGKYEVDRPKVNYPIFRCKGISTAYHSLISGQMGSSLFSHQNWHIHLRPIQKIYSPICSSLAAILQHMAFVGRLCTSITMLPCKFVPRSNDRFSSLSAFQQRTST